MRVTLGDGRIAQYWSGGASPGPVVLFFHGCPDTRRIAMTGEEAAQEAGVRLLCVNRPGYGVATAAASTHTSVARDATELLDLWGIEEVAVLGMSVGGPYAAAFAATYPDRVTALGLVASPAMTETADDTVEDAMERLRPEFEAWRTKIDPDDEDDEALAARFLAGLPEADAALLGERGTEFVAGVVWEALRQAGGLPPRRRSAVPRLGLPGGGRALPDDAVGRRGRREGDGRRALVDRAVAGRGAARSPPAPATWRPC